MNEEDRSAPTRIMTAAEISDAELAASRTATTDRLPASPSRAIIDSLPTPTPVQVPPSGPGTDFAPVAPAIKPGWRTSEFWLRVTAHVLTVLFASGVITGDVAIAIAGIVASELGSLGYTVSRTQLKAKA